MKNALDYFNYQMALIFPDKITRAYMDDSLGKHAINFRFIYVDLPKTYTKLEYANAMTISFNLFLTNNEGYILPEFKMESSFSWQYTENGLISPEIKGTDINTLGIKLVAWFESNKALILSTKKEMIIA